jgi:hypothetical protein
VLTRPCCPPQIDNFAYAMFLPEDIRARVEAAGRCELAGTHQTALTWSKIVLVASVPLAIMLPLPMMLAGVQSLYLAANAVPFLAYLLSVYAMEFGPGSRGAAPPAAGGEAPACRRRGRAVRSRQNLKFTGLTQDLGQL